MWFNWLFFFPQEKLSGITPLVRYPTGSSDKRVNKLMFLSLIKVTFFFLIYTKLVFRYHIYNSVSGWQHLQTSMCMSYSLLCFLPHSHKLWGGNRRNGFCDVECLKYRDVINSFFCSPCKFVPICFARSTRNLVINLFFPTSMNLSFYTVIFGYLKWTVL